MSSSNNNLQYLSDPFQYNGNEDRMKEIHQKTDILKDQIRENKRENKNWVQELNLKNNQDGILNIQYNDANGLMTKRDYLQLNKKILNVKKMNGYKPYPNSEIPFSTWSLYKTARNLKGLLTSSIKNDADSIFFSKSPKSEMEKNFLSYILRPYLIQLLKTNTQYREQVLKEKVPNYLSKHDFSGTPLGTELNALIKANNDENAKNIQKEVNITTHERQKALERVKKMEPIPCHKICNYLLKNADKKHIDNPYTSLFNRFQEFYLQALQKTKPERSEKECLIELHNLIRKNYMKNQISSELVKSYLCSVLRKNDKNKTERIFCQLIQNEIKKLRIDVKIILTNKDWQKLFNNTPKIFQKELQKHFAILAQPEWTHFKLECPSDLSTLQPFLNHQQVCEFLFTPQCPMRGLLVWHTVGTGKTCLAIENMSYSWEGHYNILWVTRETLKNAPLESMFSKKLECGNAMDICHKRAREDYGNPDSRIRKSCQTSGANTDIKFPELFSKYANWDAYSETKRKKNLKDFNKFNSGYKTKSIDNRILKYSIYGGTLLSKSKDKPTSGRMREWGMADQHGQGNDYFRKTLIVLDEAHNLFNEDLPNTEKNWIKKMIPQICQNIWNSYVKSKNDSCRVLLLTATPFTQSDNPESFFKLINLLLPPKGYITPTSKVLDSNEMKMLYPENKQYVGFFPTTIKDIKKKYGFLINEKYKWNPFAELKECDQWTKEEKETFNILLEKTKGLISYFDFSNNPNYFPLKIYVQPIAIPLRKLQCSYLFKRLKIDNLEKNKQFHGNCTGIRKINAKACTRSLHCLSPITKDCNKPCTCLTPTNTNVSSSKIIRKTNTKAKTKNENPTLLDEWFTECNSTFEASKVFEIVNKFTPLSKDISKDNNHVSNILIKTTLANKKKTSFPYQSILGKINLRELSDEDIFYIRGLENGVYEIKEKINQKTININNFKFNENNVNSETFHYMKLLEQSCNKYDELFKQIDIQDKNDMMNYGKTFKHVIYTDIMDVKLNTGIPWLCTAAFLYGFKMNSFEVRENKIQQKRPSSSNQQQDQQKKPKQKSYSVSIGEPEQERYTQFSNYIYTPERLKSKINYNVLTLTSSPLYGYFFFKGPKSELLYYNPPGLKNKPEHDAAVKDSYIKSITRTFNDPKTNKYGERFRFLFIDSTFKEGISLSDARHFWLLEPPKSRSSLDQALGRVARLCNTNLPYGLYNRTTKEFEPGWKVLIHTLFSYIPFTGDLIHNMITGKNMDDTFLTSYLQEIVKKNAADYLINCAAFDPNIQYYQKDYEYHRNHERKFTNHPADREGERLWKNPPFPKKTTTESYVSVIDKLCQELGIP